MHQTFVNSDNFIWGKPNIDYPNRDEIREGIKKFAEDNDLIKYVSFNTEVIHLRQIAESHQIEIITKNSLTQVEEINIFNFILIAVGIYQSPNMILDKIQKNNQQVQIIHSKDYNTLGSLEGKKIIVIGNSHSGSQIAVETSRSAKSVISLFRRPSYIYSRYMQKEGKTLHTQLNCYFTNRELRRKMSLLDEPEKLKKINFMLSSIYNQNEYHETLFIDPNSDERFNIAIDDFYLQYAKEGKFVPKIGEIEKIESKNVILKSGEIIYDVDLILLATGFHPNLSFLSEELFNIFCEPIQQRKSYSAGLNLDYFHVANRIVKNITFAGVHYLSGSLILLLEATLALEYLIRGGNPVREISNRLENYDKRSLMAYQESLAEELGLLPDTDEIEKFDPELAQWLKTGPINYNHYKLNGLDSSTENFQKIREEIKGINLKAQENIEK
jgi:hypothetical protein